MLFRENDLFSLWMPAVVSCFAGGLFLQGLLISLGVDGTRWRYHGLLVQGLLISLRVLINGTLWVGLAHSCLFRCGFCHCSYRV